VGLWTTADQPEKGKIAFLLHELINQPDQLALSILSFTLVEAIKDDNERLSETLGLMLLEMSEWLGKEGLELYR
jgi:hypothetical protein